MTCSEDMWHKSRVAILVSCLNSWLQAQGEAKRETIGNLITLLYEAVNA